MIETTHILGVSASGICIATFGGECIGVVNDLRWLILLIC